MFKLIIEDAHGKEHVSYFNDRNDAVMTGEREARIYGGEFWIVYES